VGLMFSGALCPWLLNELVNSCGEAMGLRLEYIGDLFRSSKSYVDAIGLNRGADVEWVGLNLVLLLNENFPLTLTNTFPRLNAKVNPVYY
jgi:hypothetical protein